MRASAWGCPRSALWEEPADSPAPSLRYSPGLVADSSPALSSYPGPGLPLPGPDKRFISCRQQRRNGLWRHWTSALCPTGSSWLFPTPDNQGSFLSEGHATTIAETYSASVKNCAGVSEAFAYEIDFHVHPTRSIEKLRLKLIKSRVRSVWNPPSLTVQVYAAFQAPSQSRSPVSTCPDSPGGCHWSALSVESQSVFSSTESLFRGLNTHFPLSPCLWIWVLAAALPQSNGAMLGKSSHFSEPLFPHL